MATASASFSSFLEKLAYIDARIYCGIGQALISAAARRKMMQFLNRMNGWQRLWLALAAPWSIGSAAVTIYNYPTYDSMMAAYGRDDTPPVNCDAGLDVSIVCIQRKIALEDLQSKNRTAQSDAVSGAIGAKQSETIEKGVALFFVPMFSLYLIGLAVAWVREGFNK